MELNRYLVELERPEEGWARLQQTAADARAAAAALRAEGVPVRFLRSVFVPEDDACFLLYEGPSPRAVREAAERSAAAVSRIAGAAKLHAAREREPKRETK
jgi:hypothetical protein